MKRTFLRFAAFMLLAMGGTAASFAEEVTDVTFGFKRALDSTNGTCGDVELVSGHKGVTLSWIESHNESIRIPEETTFTLNGVTYTTTGSANDWKFQMGGTFGFQADDNYFGYEMKIQEGYTLTLTKLDVEYFLSSKGLGYDVGVVDMDSPSDTIRLGATEQRKVSIVELHTTIENCVLTGGKTYRVVLRHYGWNTRGWATHYPLTFMITGNVSGEAVAAPGFSITDAGYATVVTPADKAVTFPNDVKVWKATKIDGSTVTMTELSGIIPAATPVLVSGSKGDYELTTTDEDATADVTGNMLIGYNTDTEITATDMESYTYYSLNAAEDGTAGFYRRTEAFTAKAGKAYLRVNGATQTNTAKMGMFFDDNTTTGISGIEANKSVNGVYYNLNGQRISAPTKGLYILNGKKYVSK